MTWEELEKHCKTPKDCLRVAENLCDQSVAALRPVSLDIWSPRITEARRLYACHAAEPTKANLMAFTGYVAGEFSVTDYSEARKRDILLSSFYDLGRVLRRASVVGDKDMPPNTQDLTGSILDRYARQAYPEISCDKAYAAIRRPEPQPMEF
jgi:hypothetical protein